MKTFIQHFDANMTRETTTDVTLLGKKGSGLIDMARMGLPVPPGFVITTEVYRLRQSTRYAAPGTALDGVREAVYSAVKRLEHVTGLTFGDPQKPLLVSVRSGAVCSMPGMMDTLLNLGLNSTTVKGLTNLTDNPYFAYDCYKRFLESYRTIVLKHTLQTVKDNTLDNLKLQCQSHQAVCPESCKDQLWQSILAVLDSWHNERAAVYRAMHHIPESMGTAVTVQAMVFGNLNKQSATGVVFTRNPSDGTKQLFGEYLIQAQGEDIVSGIVTPLPLLSGSGHPEAMESVMPRVFQTLMSYLQQLELFYRDMLDVEFTVESGRVWILQVRPGKRTPLAACCIVKQLVQESVISEEEAILRIDPHSLVHLLHPNIALECLPPPIAVGLNASPGAASGRLAFSVGDVLAYVAQKIPCILVRRETSPDDIQGMQQAMGILTERGGMTSHAAVVARGMGKPCVVGANIRINDNVLYINNEPLSMQDTITLDGTIGHVYRGTLPIHIPDPSVILKDDLMIWADRFRRMRIRINADTPEDIHCGRSLGAEGIGLCRTEHMFLESERLHWLRCLIIAHDKTNALQNLLPVHQQDIANVLLAAGHLPITIRLLDPPLHEFLPTQSHDIKRISDTLTMPITQVEYHINLLKETNPMLGLRGARLGMMMPAIYDMQCRAIFNAMAIHHAQHPHVEIMVPFVMNEHEYTIIRDIIINLAEHTERCYGCSLHYKIGSMIELPVAALRAGPLADFADFLSFGTNDLTQTALGLSRDDLSNLLDTYVARGIFKHHPFQSISEETILPLIQLAVEKSRLVNPNIKLGICGEHGGDPQSIDWFEAMQLDYVSCSPFRVLAARLAAAQAAIRRSKHT
jgi:pyruvate, orthophosphate dikinase